MNQLSEKQSNRIQVLRGLAIIAVVISHNTPIGLAQVYCRPFVNFCVGLFLFLSGMLSSAERWNPKKRILKVIIPYIIWTLIFVIFRNSKTPAQIPISYLYNLITARSAAVMYYVFVYCELTLLIPLIDKLAKSKYKWVGFLISPIEIILMRLFPLVIGYEMNNYVQILKSISCVGWFIYFYLGYLLGNGHLKIKLPASRIKTLWVFSIALQMLEGYWYLSMGESNCGTQLKITSILSGTLFVLLAYMYINTSKEALAPRILHVFGDYSFGIFFSHLAVMKVLKQIPFYKRVYYSFPINAIIAFLLSLMCVILGRKALGKYGKYLAL